MADFLKTLEYKSLSAASQADIVDAPSAVWMDTTNRVFRIHDGVTAGGIIGARADLENVLNATFGNKAISAGVCEASNIAYPPAVPGNWTTVPNQVALALDVVGATATENTVQIESVIATLATKISKGATVTFCIDNGDFATLQDAIDVTPVGGVVLVGPKWDNNGEGTNWGDITLKGGVDLVGLGAPQNSFVAVQSVTWAVTTGTVATLENQVCMSNIIANNGINIVGSNSYRLRLDGIYSVVTGAIPAVNVTNGSAGSAVYARNCLFNSHGTGPCVVFNGAYAPWTDCSIQGGDFAISVNSPTAVLVLNRPDIEYNKATSIIQIEQGAVYMSLGLLENDATNGSGVSVATGSSFTSFLNQYKIASGTGYVVNGTGDFSYDVMTFRGANTNIQNSLTIAQLSTTPTVVA